jgi:membrane-bound serine protease (ClpP class)
MAVISYGLLTAGGLISLALGSMILVDTPSPGLQLSLSFVVPVIVGFAGIAMLLVRLAVKAQRQPPVTGEAAMLGQMGQALTAIETGSTGNVATRGEIWQAVADESIPAGARVRVTAVNGLTLTVRKE